MFARWTILALAGCAALIVADSAATADPVGIISGTVRLEGKPPQIPAVAPRHDTAVCGQEPRPLQVLELGAGQVVRNAIVYLNGGALKRPDGGAKPVVLDQQGCSFSPRIQIADDGAVLQVKNSDPVLHMLRIDALGGNKRSNAMLDVATPYAGYSGQFRLAYFREPTLLRITNTNGRRWMVAYMAVMPHPWAVLTDENGKFALRDVPVGAHKLYVWHEVLGVQALDVVVAGGREKQVSIVFGGAK